MNEIQQHVLRAAGRGEWREVPRTWFDGKRWLEYRGFHPAVRKLVDLGYIHARTATLDRIGARGQLGVPEPHPKYPHVMTQAMLTEQGSDRYTLLCPW
jgi:hypothetical protein